MPDRAEYAECPFAERIDRFAPLAALLAVWGLVALAPIPEARAADSAEGESSETSVPQNPSELRDEIRALLDEHDVPAAGVAVVEDGSVAIADGFGVADRADDREATSETLFRLGSVSKSFVGLAVLALRERDDLALDEEAASVTPDLPLENRYADGEPVRIVHLLEHTAGLEDLGLAGVAVSEPGLDPLEGLRRARERWRVRWPPGRYFAYSNAGPTMAAAIVEQTAGESFEQVTRETIFEPLGMNSAVWQPDEADMQRMAVGYRSDGTTPVPYKHLLIRPAGGLSMTPPDMATFLRLMIERGEVDETRVFEAASIRRTEHPETTLAAKQGVETGYGLGNATRGVDGHLFSGHDGGMEGVQATYRYLPGEAGFAVSINASDGAAIEALKSTLVDYVTRELEPPEPAPRVDLDEGRLAELTGYYEPFALRHEWSRALAEPQGVVEVSRGDGELRFRPLLGAETTRLIPTGPTTFRTPESPKATTVVTDAGEMQQNVGMGTGNFRRVSGVVAWGRLVGLGLSLIVVVSAILFSLVWVPRRVFGSLDSPRLSARAATAGASWMLAAWIGVLVAATGPGWIERLGTVNAWSVAIAAASGLFVLAGVGAVGWTARLEWREVDLPDGWGGWLAAWHTRLVAASLLGLVVFLAYYRMLVLFTWDL